MMFVSLKTSTELILVLGCFFLTLISAHKLSAADVSSDDGCNFFLSGPIRAGDLSKLDDAGFFTCTPAKLYLNSPGGSVDEALSIAKSFGRTTTRVATGAECLSACAFIFMAGRTCSGAPFSCAPTRWIEPGAKLGFHAPFLTETTSDQFVPLALSFSSALDVFAQIQSTFSEISYSVRQTGYDKDIIPFDLVVKIFSTPPEEMYMIENNDQFFAFDIGLDVDISEPLQLNAKEVFNLCHNKIFSSFRGWNYSEFGLLEYHDGLDSASSTVTEFEVLNDGSKNSEGPSYLMYFEGLNMGAAVFGWCHVEPGWNDGYFTVNFYGGFNGPDDKPTREQILSNDTRVLRPYWSQSESMHFSLALPFETPVTKAMSLIKTSTKRPLLQEEVAEVVLLVHDYFRALNGASTASNSNSAEAYWISERRREISKAIERVCGGAVTSVHSTWQNGGSAFAEVTSKVRGCESEAWEEYRIVVELVKISSAWEISGIKSSN